VRPPPPEFNCVRRSTGSSTYTLDMEAKAGVSDLLLTSLWSSELVSLANRSSIPVFVRIRGSCMSQARDIHHALRSIYHVVSRNGSALRRWALLAHG